MHKIKVCTVTAIAAITLGACGQSQTAGDRPTPAVTTTPDAPPPPPPSSWWSAGDTPETSESPVPSPKAKPTTKPNRTKRAAINGCIDAFSRKLDVPPDTLSFTVDKFGKSVAAGGPNYYTAVGWLIGPDPSDQRSAICDAIKIVNGKVVPEKFPPIIAIGQPI